MLLPRDFCVRLASIAFALQGKFPPPTPGDCRDAVQHSLLGFAFPHKVNSAVPFRAYHVISIRPFIMSSPHNTLLSLGRASTQRVYCASGGFRMCFFVLLSEFSVYRAPCVSGLILVEKLEIKRDK